MDYKNGAFFFGMIGTTCLSALAGYVVNKHVTNYIEDRKKYQAMLEEQKKFEYKYMEEFMATERNELSEDQKKELSKKHIRMEVDQGEVVMFYSKELESFAWYCDTKEVPYKYLETVARKYVIDNNCSCIYAIMHEELKKGRERQAQAVKEHAEKDKKHEEPKSSSVFANLKSYNKKTATDMMNNKNWLIKENANRYSYRGKLEDYDKYIQDRSSDKPCDSVEVTKLMNFAQFKKQRSTKSQPSSPSNSLAHDVV